jgi:hypothetical protein
MGYVDLDMSHFEAISQYHYNANKRTDSTIQKNPINELSDSLTFSMVEKVLDDRDSQHLVDKCSDKTNSSGNETNVKKIVARHFQH